MKLLQKLRSRQNDMKVLSTLIETSLARAAAAGDPIAGAHHLALAAFDLPDGAAELALNKLGASGGDFAQALEALDAKSLAELGLQADVLDEPASSAARSRLGKTDATFEAALQATHDIHNEHGDYRALTSAHVLAGIASVEYGVAARVFKSMGLDRGEVVTACV